MQTDNGAQFTKVMERPDTVQDIMSGFYDLAISHAIEVVKTEAIATVDVNTLLEMSNMKNRIISKLLSLKK